MRRSPTDEKIAYTLDVSDVGSTPTSPAVVGKDMSAGGTVVTSTVFPEYRVEVKYTISGNIFETYFTVFGRM
jgi:hypothetical protein